MRFPFNPNLWLNAEDIPGPEYASVGDWKDRGDGHNDAVQAEADEWPRKMLNAPDMPESVRFGQGEFLALKKPVTAPSWTLWAVFYPSLGADVIVAGPLPSLFPRLGTTYSIPLVQRFVTFSIGTLFGSVTVIGAGFAFTKPVFAKVTYDGVTLSLSCYNDLTGSASVSHPGVEYTLSFVGLPGSEEVDSPFVGELMYWQRVLSDEENAGVLRYLEGKYSEEANDMPTGAILAFAGGLTPTGYLACDGTDYAEADYPELVGAIGHTWDTFRGQSAPSAGRFRVPQLNGLALIGAGAGASNPTTSARSLADALGEETHQLSTAELASHNHAVSDGGHNHSVGGGTGILTGGGGSHIPLSPTGSTFHVATTTDDATADIDIVNEGGDSPHNNVQPCASVAYIIKT